MSVAYDPGTGWTDPDAPEWLTANPPTGSPTDLPARGADRPSTVRLTGLAATGEGLPVPPPFLVVGSAGSSASTTVAANLASVIAADNAGYVYPAVVDATPAGGDLGVRACDAHRTTSTMQDWLDDSEPSLPSAVNAACGTTTAGALVLARRGDDPLPGRESLLSVHRHLVDAGVVPVYDAGAPIHAAAVRPFLYDPRIPVALTVQARPDAINRLATVLRWLHRQFGEAVVGDVTIVVSHQTPNVGPHDYAQHVRDYAGDWVNAVVAIPYDPHLAEGGEITWVRIDPATQAAYRRLLGVMR
ncbi:hypothetical protein JGU71_28865 [Antrihabitans sp. YC3-6]|uniref:MinD-like ATPase involved in chromosome partitioning or flagellar assembly n=1 Tax=Antrihabitans stalagmiti TaxID=2799499 RepID=A0A934NWJ3_9NOCA|nr:hypothetical protein [Antrihabitans stalagmiti]MBJ8342909.1 hypothetical protein [Antrihabitans stalagmiti]